MKKIILSIALILFFVTKARSAQITSLNLGTYVMVGGLATDTTTVNRQLALAATTYHFTKVRLNVDQWALMEPSSGVYNSTIFDKIKLIVNLATGTYGMDVVWTLPINNSAGWLPIAFATPVADPQFGTVPYTHYVTSDVGKIYWIAFKISTAIGPSTHVTYEAWNEPNLEYQFCASSSANPATVAAYMTVMRNQRQGVFDALAPSTPSFKMAGLYDPQRYIAFYTPNGSWMNQAITAGIGDLTNVWDGHCYGDAGCSMDILASTIALWSTQYGATKPVWGGEINTFGGSYPSGNINDEETRKTIFFSSSVPLGVGSNGIAVYFYQDLIGNDQAMLNADYTERLSAVGWRAMTSVLLNTSYVGTTNTGPNLNVIALSQPSTFWPAYVAYTSSSTQQALFNPYPQLSIRTLMDTTTAQFLGPDWGNVQVSTVPFFVKVSTPFGVQEGRR